jgi:hypothetical protein
MGLVTPLDSRLEVKNGGDIPPIANTSSWGGALILRDSFTFTLLSYRELSFRKVAYARYDVSWFVG